jgi:predicted small secreted protein
MRKGLFGLIIVATLAILPACNTVRGVGEDLESVADTVDRET